MMNLCLIDCYLNRGVMCGIMCLIWVCVCVCVLNSEILNYYGTRATVGREAQHNHTTVAPRAIQRIMSAAPLVGCGQGAVLAAGHMLTIGAARGATSSRRARVRRDGSRRLGRSPGR